MSTAAVVGVDKSWNLWLGYFWQALAGGRSVREAIRHAHQRLPLWAPEPNPRSVWRQYDVDKLSLGGEYKW
jgi:hypothetical protein